VKTKLDDRDWELLGLLQRDARVSFSDLARELGMSAPAVTERVRRLEDAGVIRGYRAELDLEKLGLTVLAIVRLKYPTNDYGPLDKVLKQRPELLECHHVTGEDCFVIKVACTSMEHLERVTGALGRVGSTTTSVVFSTKLQHRAIAPFR
jgi:Lrp/AsnC family leucine-responsive transcriptional regulator